nr:unnamed protein product [Callosobruchus chinensis]
MERGSSETDLARSQSDFAIAQSEARSLAALTGKRIRASATFLAMQETVKEKLQKMKEARLARYSDLQLPQRHVCDMVAMYLGLEPNEVMEGVIDDQLQVDLLNDLLDNGPLKCIFYYYQDGPPYPLESGRSNPSIKTDIKRILVTTGEVCQMKERAVAVYKISNVVLDLKNITDEVYFIQFDMDNGNANTAEVLYNLLADLIKIPLSIWKEWGDLPKTENGRLQKINFDGDFECFVTFLDKTKQDLSGVVYFNWDAEILREISENREKSFFNKELIQKLEMNVRVWHKLIERCLVQFQQLRREDEFVGPEVEIEYWRRQLARFTCLIWKKHVNAVYDTKNECSDNVKYLYSLEKYWEPFYRLDPPELAKHLPPLLYAVRMVFTTSRYYNSTGNITALLVKVSNQMIKKCRDYLDCNGTKTIWNQPKQLVLEKIKVCLDLYLKYYQCFKKTKRQIEERGEKPMECSEMFIFGKFETFKKRCEQIVFVINTTVKYSILQSSTIEGIDEFANKFIEFFRKISKQKYDALNHRLPYFDNDYKEFRQNVVDTEWELEEFVGSSLEKMTDVDNDVGPIKYGIAFKGKKYQEEILESGINIFYFRVAQKSLT